MCEWACRLLIMILDPNCLTTHSPILPITVRYALYKALLVLLVEHHILVKKKVQISYANFRFGTVGGEFSLQRHLACELGQSRTKCRKQTKKWTPHKTNAGNEGSQKR